MIPLSSFFSSFSSMAFSLDSPACLFSVPMAGFLSWFNAPLKITVPSLFWLITVPGWAACCLPAGRLFLSVVSEDVSFDCILSSDLSSFSGFFSSSWGLAIRISLLCDLLSSSWCCFNSVFRPDISFWSFFRSFAFSAADRSSCEDNFLICCWAFVISFWMLLLFWTFEFAPVICMTDMLFADVMLLIPIETSPSPC